MDIAVIVMDPIPSHAVEVMADIISSKGNGKFVIDSGHSILLETTENGGGILPHMIADSVRVDVGGDSLLVCFDACLCVPIGVPVGNSSEASLIVIAFYMPDCDGW